jgi:hypothetical protein
MRFTRSPSSLALLMLLAGCGGGGGGTDEEVAVVPGPASSWTPSPTPTFSPTPAPTSTISAVARWRPAIGDTWQWQLHDKVNVGYAVKVYDIDLFDTPQVTIDTLHARGVRVICYFSAGSSEDFRGDYGRFASADMGKALDHWEGERWLDARSVNVRAIMRDRIALATAKRCDAVEPDNVDGFSNDSGFNLSASDQLDFNRFLSMEAHRRSLAVGLKNDLDQIPELVGTFDFAVNEQCHEFKECDRLRPFIAAAKPIFNAEYLQEYVVDAGGARSQLCATARSESIRSLVLPLELDDTFRYSCD